MPTTQSFASDPKYATPQVIQAPGPRAGPCILPIVRDGKKVSSTHYYLLPERPPYLERYQRFLHEAQSPKEPDPMPVPLLLPPPIQRAWLTRLSHHQGTGGTFKALGILEGGI